MAGLPNPSSDSEIRVHIVQSFLAGNVDVAQAFYSHPKILVAALNGPAVGLSAALVACADFVYATPHAFLLTPFSSLGLVTEGVASFALVERLGISKANEALIMSKRITCEELVATGFVNKVFSAPSGKVEDSAGFLAQVLKELDERLGSHLNPGSMLGIKALIRRPGRDAMEKMNIIEAFAGVDRFLSGAPQEEFKKISSGKKKHKL